MIIHFPPAFHIQIIKRNGVWQKVPGSWSRREAAVAYGDKYYARRYRVIEPKEA